MGLSYRSNTPERLIALALHNKQTVFVAEKYTVHEVQENVDQEVALSFFRSLVKFNRSGFFNQAVVWLRAFPIIGGYELI